MKLKKIAYGQKDKLIKMLIEYFKEIDPSKLIMSSKAETLDYPFLDSYWEDETRTVFEIIEENNSIGFVLVNEWIINKEYNAKKSVAEFYINPQWRRKGIGKKVAFDLFNKFKTKWEIRQSQENNIAINFWRSVINEFTKGNFSEIKTHKNTSMNLQLFDSSLMES